MARSKYFLTAAGAICRVDPTMSLPLFVDYIRFAGERAECVSWTAVEADAALGWTDRELRAVVRAR